MRKLISSLLIVLLLYSVLPQNSYALSCVYSIPADAMTNYDGVIVATVTDVKVNDFTKKRTVTATVNESYKGVTSKSIMFTEDYGWGSSKVDASFTYFLNQENDNWFLPLCSDVAMIDGDERSEQVYAMLQQYPQLELNNNLARYVVQSTDDEVIEPQSGEMIEKEIFSPLMWIVASVIVIFIIIAALFVRHKKREKRYK